MRSRRNRGARKRVFYLFFIVLLILGGFLVVRLWSVFSVGAGLLFTKGINLKETTQRQVSVLLLGVGGGTHDGPDLTDTIMLANIDPNTKKVTLISLPRDFWSPELHAKINTAYTFGEEKQPGGGLPAAKSAVGKILGQQIDYAVKVDFDGFVKAVDLVGGLDMSVDNTFDDYAYPITGNEDKSCGLTSDQIATASAQIATGSATELDSFPCRFEHLHFDRGAVHMDGTTALKYVRSRHALGVEGSDFARSRRQQKVIEAFKEKVFSLGIILNPVKALELFNVIKGSIVTDIKEDEYDDFIRLAQQLRGAKITNTVIDTGDGDRLGLLINPPISDTYGKQWVLSPRIGNGDYTEISQYVACEIQSGNCIVGQQGILTPTPILQITGSAKKLPGFSPPR